MVYPIAGLSLGAVSAGIRYANRLDLVLISIAKGASIAGVFTKNAFCAAPVQIAKKHQLEQCMSTHHPRYFLINTGNANAGTGPLGFATAMRSCEALAHLVDVPISAVLPFSTGVIGEPLPIDPILKALPDLVSQCTEAAQNPTMAASADAWWQAARAMMTTDTRPKAFGRCFEFEGKQINITGIAKGSGMICPNMATMLAFIATDLAVSSEVLQSCLNEVAEDTFNAISVDGDTSTNDACMLIATGRVEGLLIESHQPSPLLDAFKEHLKEVCLHLAHDIVRDGEGATKFVAVEVINGKTKEECKQVAYAVAHSPLVKTALFASDANWGRILAAVGNARVADLDVNLVNVWLNAILVVEQGGRASSYVESLGSDEMKKPEITVKIDLNRGLMSACVWTCDFSFDYVKINAEYRS